MSDSSFQKKTSIQSSRYNWLDWMKTIGMVLIVYGHFFSLFDIYVYVFSVPLFFLISGFLSKVETENNVFFKKLWYNLVVPLMIICTMNYLIDAIRGSSFADAQSFAKSTIIFLGKMLIGMQSAIGVFWFVYTLIILKIILQFTKKTYIHYVWFILFSFLAYIVNNYEIEVTGGKMLSEINWSAINTFVSYPFFIIGHSLRKWRGKISSYETNKLTPLWMVLSLIGIFLCGHCHQYVYLYKCSYGDSIFLCIFGGLAGSALVFFISKYLQKTSLKIITEISTGTIIILGFHSHLIRMFRIVFKSASVLDILFTIITILFFIPIIRFCRAYIPIIMGKFRLSK